MIVTITAESETSIGNKSKAIVFRWNMTAEQLNKINELANELVGEK